MVDFEAAHLPVAGIQEMIAHTQSFRTPSRENRDYALQMAIEAVIATESELASVIESLTDAQYSLKPVGVVSSSVGSHVRHCLDHVDALLGSVDSQQLNYDNRRQGTDIESRRAAALDAIRRHVEQLPRTHFITQFFGQTKGISVS
jgi:hypothetical protein